MVYLFLTTFLSRGGYFPISTTNTAPESVRKHTGSSANEMPAHVRSPSRWSAWCMVHGDFYVALLLCVAVSLLCAASRCPNTPELPKQWFRGTIGSSVSRPAASWWWASLGGRLEMHHYRLYHVYLAAATSINRVLCMYHTHHLLGFSRSSSTAVERCQPTHCFLLLD